MTIHFGSLVPFEEHSRLFLHSIQCNAKADFKSQSVLLGIRSSYWILFDCSTILKRKIGILFTRLPVYIKYFVFDSGSGCTQL